MLHAMNFACLIITLNNKQISIIDIIVSSIKRILKKIIRQNCAMFVKVLVLNEHYYLDLA